MKQSVRLVLLVLLFWGAHSANAQQDGDGDVVSADSTEFDEQNIQPSDGSRVGRILSGVRATAANQLYAATISLNGASTSKRVVGAVISNTEVLLSASAVLSAGNITSITVAVGSTPSILSSVFHYNYKGYELHSGFDPVTLANDVAIITIADTFARDPNVKPIAISTSEIAVSTTNRTKCVVVGWGQSTAASVNYILYQAEYELLTDQECAVNETIPSSILCARSVLGYACQFDGGAPLVCNGQLYGILTAQTSCTVSSTAKIHKFAKLPAIKIPWDPITLPAPPRKNYVSCL